MKKNILISIVAMLCLCSCEDNFDPQIYGSLFSSNFPKSESDYEAYMMGCYIPFTGRWNYVFSSYQYPFYSVEAGIIKLFDIPSDYCNPALVQNWGGAWLFWSLDNFTNSALYTGSGPNGGSPNHYEKIREVTRMTEIIGTLERAEGLSDVKKRNFTGEARLLRGMEMYYLLHIYGPVPVIVNPELVGNPESEQNLVRPTLDEMAQWIYDDLDYAQQNMSNTAPNGRYTADYARFCLMRHCLNEGSYKPGWYDKAIEMYQALKASTRGYALYTQGGSEAYAGQFSQSNKFNSEVIMAMSVSAEAEGDINGDFFPVTYYMFPSDAAGYADVENTIPTPFLLGAGWGQVYNVAPLFYESYEEGDVRQDIILTSYIRNNAERSVVSKADLGVLWDGYILHKYQNELSNAMYQAHDFPLARWADVLLMYAEAVARKTQAVPAGDAMQAVTDVRARAGLPPLSGTATASYEGFMEALLAERGHELLYEGHRKIDLIRFNKFCHNIKAIKNLTPTHQYLPIPDYAVRQAGEYGKSLTQTYERPEYAQDQ
jgi:hypothetical protein